MTELFKNLSEPTATVAPTETPATPAKTAPEAVKPAVATSGTTSAVAPSVVTPAPVITAPEDETEAPQISELDMLKKRADLMQVKYSNNIGVEALKAKINAKLNNEPDTTDVDGQVIKIAEPEKKVEPVQTSQDETTEVSKPVVKRSLRQYMLETQMKLVRLRITNLDPKKKDLPGEIITVANEYLGTVRKFVPYGAVTDGGYHVPYCIYDVLKERMFVSIKTRKGNRGQTIVENQDAREFSLEVLPPLTASELAQLATAQQAKGGLTTD